MFLLFVSICVFSVCADDKPLYKYRYKTEDIMKTAASSYPIRGYRVVEGGYYPYEENFNDGNIEESKLGYVYPKITYGPRFDYPYRSIRLGYEPGYLRHHYPEEQEIVDRNVYEGGRKNVIDENYGKKSGQLGEVSNRDHENYNHGQTAIKNIKGDSGYYNEEEGSKKLLEDGKHYQGAEHFAEQAKNEGEKKINTGHKKGHNIKGFKTSHHKDESGKTEEYYDEENDEGNNAFYNGQQGIIGKNSAATYKGGHADGLFNNGESKKEGHYEQEHLVDEENVGKGSSGAKKYGGNQHVYEVNNGIDQQSLLGHQESDKYYKRRPYNTPFFGAGYRR